MRLLEKVISAITVGGITFTLIQQCNGNLACFFSLEIAQNFSCWVYHHLGTHHWSSFPFDNDTAAEGSKKAPHLARFP